MSFKWQDFLDGRGIEYATTGKNVGHGRVNVQCPFCDDPSQHMSLEADGSRWKCWRCSTGGAGPEYLVRVMIGCTPDEAKRIVKGFRMSQTLDEAMEKAAGLFVGVEGRAAAPNRQAEWDEFTPLYKARDQNRCLAYLRRRGYPDARRVAHEYDLRYTMRGLFAGRILFPVSDGRRVYGWTGRTTIGNKSRYRASGQDVNRMVYNADRAKGGVGLFVVEGPFDALKLDYFTPHDVHAVAMMTTTTTPDQLAVLARLAPRYDAIRVVPDRGAIGKAADLVRELSAFGASVALVGEEYEDPGALSPRQAQLFSEEVFG